MDRALHPLLVSSAVPLSEADREKFDKDVSEIATVKNGDVVSIPFPIVLFHRIEGTWLPVSDLGAFQSPHDEIAPTDMACNDAED